MSSTPYGWLDRAALERRVSQRIHELEQSGSRKDSLRRADLELLGERHWPQRHHTLLPAIDPGADVAFLTVANDRFYRGLEALLLSLRAVYPQLSSPVVVIHDGTLGPFLQRRLAAIHQPLRFAQPEPAWADTLPRNSRNRRRIGALGYLNSEALALRGFRRVIVLDADLLITGSLDPLWAEGETFRAVPDCGDRPWAAVSSHTGRPVLNSGVLSLPGSALNSQLQRRMEQLIRNAAEPVCPLLDRFADQKVWNQLLADQPVELLPLNFNCNVKYLVQFLGGCSEGLSVLHFAGPKPWLTWPWIEPDPADRRPGAVQDHLLWNRCYRAQLMAWRLATHQQANQDQPPLRAGPSQLALDPSRFDRQADGSRHLLLADPQLFGAGWPDQCQWPEAWLPALAAAAPLQIWAPLLWQPALSALPLPPDVHWRWVLMEPPFSAELSDGEDLLADTGAWGAGFEPWSDPWLPALERAVRRRLRDAGAVAVAEVAGSES